MTLSNTLRLRTTHKPAACLPLCCPIYCAHFHALTARTPHTHVDNSVDCLIHHQRMRHSALAVRKPHTGTVAVAETEKPSESTSTSVAYRCLRSCLSQHFHFSDAGLANPETLERTSHSKKKIDIIVKPHRFRLPNGKQTCIYNVYTGINEQLHQRPGTDTSPPEVPKDANDMPVRDIVAARPAVPIRIRTAAQQAGTEKLECAISLIPRTPWKHEEMVELGHLAALRFSFPSAYHSLVAAIPSLSPTCGEGGELLENGPADVYTPLVRFYLQTERTALSSLRKLIHKICYLAEKVEVLSADPTETRRLSLSIFSETAVAAAAEDADAAHAAECTKRAEAHAGKHLVARMGGVSVSVERRRQRRPGGVREADVQLITLSAETDCAELTWFSLYAEALRLIDPTIFHVFFKMLAQRPVFRSARVVLDTRRAGLRIAQTLQGICGKPFVVQLSPADRGRVCCSAVTRVGQTARRSAIVHHVVGANHIEAVLQMHHFIIAHYIRHVGVCNGLPHNNLNTAPGKQVSPETLRGLLPCLTDGGAADPRGTTLRFVVDLLQKCGSTVTFSTAEDAALRHAMGGPASTELVAVVIQVGQDGGTDAGKPLKTLTFVGSDYESTLVKAVLVFFAKYHPKHQNTVSVYFAAKKVIERQMRRMLPKTPSPAEAQEGEAPEISLLDKIRGNSVVAVSPDKESPDNSQQRFSIHPESNPKEATYYDVAAVFAGNAPVSPALAIFYAQHEKQSSEKAPASHRRLAVTAISDSLHRLASRLIQMRFTPSAVLRTYVFRKSKHSATNSTFIEKCLQLAPQDAGDGLYSGFAWVTIETERSASAAKQRLDDSIRSFLRQGDAADPSVLSVVAAVHNSNSHAQCVAALDGAVLDNLFPEVRGWLGGVAARGAAKGPCFALPPARPLSFVPASGDKSRLDILRQCVAEYFGCDRLREVSARSGILFDIHLLHPETGEPTGLSLRGASSPLLGLQDLYESVLLSNEHANRFSAARRRFIAREAVFFRGSTHRSSESLVQFVRRQMRRATGLNVHFAVEWHLDEVVWKVRAVAMNAEGHQIELLTAANLRGTERATLINQVALTLCRMFFPGALQTARKLNRETQHFISCDFASHVLPYKGDLPLPAKKKWALPEPMLPCVLTDMLGSLRAKLVSGGAFVPVQLECVRERGGGAERECRATIHLQNEERTVIATHTSASALWSAQKCCGLLFAEMHGREWTIVAQAGSGAKQCVTLRPTRPIARHEMTIEPPRVRLGHGQLLRLLRHCVLAFFGLEVHAAVSTEKERNVLLAACGAHQQRISLAPAAATAKNSINRACADALRLHFPEVLDRVEALNEGIRAPAAKAQETSKAPCSAAAPSYSIPASDRRCTLGLMRAAYASAFHHAPAESVRISGHDELSIAVAVLDDRRAPVERHAGRSLPFSLMECYGNLLRRSPAAMAAFEALERDHPYAPPEVPACSAGEGVYALLEYLVRYELGLETICRVDVQRADGAPLVTVVLSAVTASAAELSQVGEEVVLGRGWHADEQAARRFAALISIKTHFPLYYGKHGLRIDDAVKAEKGNERASVAAREATPKLGGSRAA